jgi:SAM-dependent methyltransferase
MATLKSKVLQLLGSRGDLVLEPYYLARATLFHWGDRHFCPCCGAHVGGFLSMIHPFRGRVERLICPRCDAHARHRLLWSYFVEQHRELFEQELRLLHVAPEFCFLRHFRRMKNLLYTTVDLTSPFAEHHADICRLPFADASFDVVLCNHVLEHVADDATAMGELCRVLKPDGWGVMQVPIDSRLKATFEDPRITDPRERELRFGQHDHVRLYGTDYAERLTRAGFSVEIIDYCGAMTAERIERCGLERGEEIYLCRKASRQSRSPSP